MGHTAHTSEPAQGRACVVVSLVLFLNSSEEDGAAAEIDGDAPVAEEVQAQHARKGVPR